MNNQGVDKSKRQFLTSALTVVGAVGTGYLAVPFLAQMQPSVKAMAAGAPVEVDISKMEPGQLLRVAWRGKPVWILMRTPEVLATLKSLDNELRDPMSEESIQPDYSKNLYRSIKPEIFVAIGICTHLGCSPTFRPVLAPADLGEKSLVRREIPHRDEMLPINLLAFMQTEAGFLRPNCTANGSAMTS